MNIGSTLPSQKPNVIAEGTYTYTTNVDVYVARRVGYTAFQKFVNAVVLLLDMKKWRNERGM
jgi:hypothetical protein